jgi:two-component system, chemotaxis family, sensor kinase CheA
MDLGDQEAELREVFVEEARERLSAMTQQLLELESRRDDPDLLAAVFREAHTLKGGAAMVGMPAIGHVAHTMEDLLTGVRDGSRPLTPDLVDALLAGVDALGRIVPAAAAGLPHEAEAEAAQRALAAAGGVLDEVEAAKRALAVAALPSALSLAPSAAEAETAPRPVVVPLPTDVARPGPGPQAGTEHTQERLAVPVERLDELVRLVGETVAGQLRLGRLLHLALGRDPEGLEEFRAFTHVLQELQDVAMRTRMVPVSRAMPGLKRAVRDVARMSDKQVRFEVHGGDTELDRRMLDQVADALLHLVRNAVDHGLETPAERLHAGKPAEGMIRIDAEQRRSEAIIVVSDDGRGIDLAGVREVAARGDGSRRDLADEEAMQLIFRSGFSTSAEVSEVSGRGVGLDVVRSRLETVQGRVEVQSEVGRGTRFTISVPITLAVVSSLLVAAGGQRFAFPMHAVAAVVAPEPRERWASGRLIMMADGRPVPVTRLASALGLGEDGPSQPRGPTVLLAGHTDRYGFRVDEVLGQRQVVVKGLSPVLPRLPAVVGASVEPDGPILLMLEAGAVIDRALGGGQALAAAQATAAPVARVADGAARVLVVDDAMIVREVERSILEQAGYEVVTASDGVEALAALAEQHLDLVVTDIDMPRMDGLRLTAEVRGMPRLAHLPVILLSARTDEESRRRGLEAGADAYVVKTGFDREALLRIVQKALGHQ